MMQRNLIENKVKLNDYKLKHRITKNRNDIKLLEYVGYSKEIAEEVIEYARKIGGVNN